MAEETQVKVKPAVKPEVKTAELKPIKITDEANRAIEAYLGWQRGIGIDISKQDALEEAVLFFVASKMPLPMRKIFGLPNVG